MIALNFADHKYFSNILICDPVYSQIMLYRTILRRAGIEPINTHDDAEALKYLAEDKELLLICRYYQLVVDVRAREEFADVSIMVASADSGIKEIVLEAGANAFLLLPASPQAIVECIKSLR